MENNFYRLHGKRLFDFVSSLIGLIVLFPFLVVISILVKINDGGPIFYRSKRIGQNFKTFYLLKFRTMVVNAEKLGPLVTTGGDQRVTRIGKFLRSSKLDELPQLWNVLKGDLSLVGPRPEVEEYVSYYKEDYKEILKVKPGITDYAAIQFSNEEEILASFDDVEKAYIKDILPRKIKLYKTFLNETGFFTDIKIIFRTLWKLTFRRLRHK
jgi:lipopolysaccharide/colanic/teichoic acid biosynthesis glycosyltransferase